MSWALWEVFLLFGFYGASRLFLCWGVYSFRLSVRMFIRDSVLSVELLQRFMLQFLKWGISQQPLIRKHSYLDHRYPGGSAFSLWLLSPGSMPQGWARSQKVFFYFSVMETTYADRWSDMTQPCDLWVMKWRSTWPIFHSPLILPHILKTIWCMNIKFRDFESV